MRDAWKQKRPWGCDSDGARARRKGNQGRRGRRHGVARGEGTSEGLVGPGGGREVKRHSSDGAGSRWAGNLAAAVWSTALASWEEGDEDGDLFAKLEKFRGLSVN